MRMFKSPQGVILAALTGPRFSVRVIWPRFIRLGLCGLGGFLLLVVEGLIFVGGEHS
jgi:hypothetical protein